jgi:hypothetical protein
MLLLYIFNPCHTLMAARRLPPGVMFGSLAAVEHDWMKVQTVYLCNNRCSVRALLH